MDVTHTAHLNIDKLKAAKLETDAVPLYRSSRGFLSPESVSRINATYPKIEKGGSYPIETLEANMAIKEVIDELDGPEFQKAIAEKFDVDLEGRPEDVLSARLHARQGRADPHRQQG